MKKFLVAFVLFMGVQFNGLAEDFPMVEVLGSSPDAEYIATIQSIVTDGKGDAVIEIKIFDAWGNAVYRMETAEECAVDNCIEAAKKEAIEMASKKLQTYKIDTQLLGFSLYTYKRAERQVDETYDFPIKVSVSAKQFTNMELSCTIGGQDDYKYNKMIFQKDPSSEKEEVYITELNSEYPKVGVEKVVLFNVGESETRILVVSAFQSQGFEGPDTSFSLNFFDL